MRMLTPDDLPLYMTRGGPGQARSAVIHNYPESWDEQEMDKHRYDTCPCGPRMVQQFADPDCGHRTGPYLWRVEHRRKLS